MNTENGVRIDANPNLAFEAKAKKNTRKNEFGRNLRKKGFNTNPAAGVMNRFNIL